MQQLSSQAKGTNWKAIVFWGVLFGIIIFAVYWYREPIIAFFQSIPARLSNLQMPDFSGFTANIVKYINENPIAVLAAGASICTAAVTLISKVRADRAKALALEEKAQVEQLATQQLELAQSKSTDLQEQLNLALANNSKEALLETQRLMQEQKGKYEMQIEGLRQQNQDLMNKLESRPVVEKVVYK